MNLSSTINPMTLSLNDPRRREPSGETAPSTAEPFDAFFGSTVAVDGSGGPAAWDFSNDLSIPTNFFENVSFLDEASTSSLTLSPKTLKGAEGEAVPALARQEEAQSSAPAPVATGTRKRRTSAAAQGPQATASQLQQQQQNWFNLCQQGPPPGPAPAVYPPGMAYGPPTSPYLSSLAAGAGGEWPSATADPYSWMHSGHPKRGFTGAFATHHLSSPPMMFAPPGAFGAVSPPFGMGPYGGAHMMMSPAPMAVPKLPMQALPPRADPAASEAASQGHMMAPLILPTDLSRRASAASSREPVIDPNAISNAISQALRSGGSTSDADSSPTSTSASLSPLGIPSGASQLENMRLYESTFEAFVKEEAAIDYSNVTVIELKKLLRKYHLAATGRKEELIRLVKDVAQFLKGNPPKASTDKAAEEDEAKQEEQEEGKKDSTESCKNEASKDKPVTAEKPDHFACFFEMS